MNVSATKLCAMLLAIFLIPATLSFGQTTGKISGTVTDAETGEPLPGVNVVLEGTDQGAATDSDGNYFIINIDPGEYSVTASMIGYQSVTKTGVLVSVNHTTPVSFQLQTEAIAGEAVTIEAEREVVRMDESSSTVSVTSEEMDEVASVTTIGDYINTQAGVEGMSIRGGSADETQFMMDGLTVVDNRQNEPIVMVNLSSVKELNVIKGGFNAEYGNVRSGLINVVTKEGTPSAYHGSVDFRMAPAYLKHSGEKVINHQSFYLRPYLDPEVMWEGTDQWPEELQNKYFSFAGWEEYARRLNENDREWDDVTAEQARDIFIWRHAVEGADALGQTVNDYANKPDWKVDASLGGPVPGISQALGDLTFFGSYREDWQMFALPTNRDYFKERNGSLKLTSHLTQNIKLQLQGLYGETHTIDGSGNSGRDILWDVGLGDPGHTNLYMPHARIPMDVYRSMGGISFKHVLSSNTFYDFNANYLKISNAPPADYRMRDTSTVRTFGPHPVDESPYGKWWNKVPLYSWGMLHPGHVTGNNFDRSVTQTINAKFDFTTQLDRFNQVKLGWTFTYNDVDNFEDHRHPGVPNSYQEVWRVYPWQVGAYIQDKLEFEGMIANFGVRVDYSNPNTEWPTVERYSQYFQKQFKDVFMEMAPKEEQEPQLEISPRLGISHPISENVKMYFNYGHFYSLAPTNARFNIDYGNIARIGGIRFLGNPSADMPKTIAYELGFDYDIGQMILLHLAGYYKNISNQTGNVYYTSYNGLVDYGTTENNNYQDIRGFELRIDKKFGDWIRGWVNYDYRVSTEGYVGREHYYQDIREMRRYGEQNPYQERPLARPIARANLRIISPPQWGPRLMGRKLFGNLGVSFLFYYRAGEYFTWDPLRTHELEDNLQWKGDYDIDAKITKRIHIGNNSLTLFADINNVFNIRQISGMAFKNSDDWENYLESLHLPMYEGQEYQDQGYTPGNDKVGDKKSADKPYIDMPDLDFMRYLDPRHVFLGIRVEF